MLPLIALILFGGCAGAHRQPPPNRDVFTGAIPTSQPRSRMPLLPEEIVDKTFDLQLQQALDLPRTVRRIAGRPYEALNVDSFDEVPNSSWFTNRNATTALTLEEIRRGAGTTGGPDTSSMWSVVALKRQGVTPGMTIVDGRGDRYIVKFDPPGFAELPSGAEAVASVLFHAAGYNVPENYIAHFDPAHLTLDEDAAVTVVTDDNRSPLSERQSRRDDLDLILRRANPRGTDRIRVLASRYLPGIPIGPFPYTGTRADDPNDIYPHEHRRELRGLYVIASWLNHADMKEENTLDMYEPQTGTITHYLIDFGASMGSNSRSPSNPRRGQANSFDLRDSVTRLLTLGLYVHDYERASRRIQHASVGYLDTDLFEPDSWKPMYPAPAFENLTNRDAFWGARIVTSFTDAQIEAAVSVGEFSDPGAAAALATFLTERRDRIGQYWLSRLNALDRFATPDASSLEFSDLAVARGYADSSATSYRFAIHTPGATTLSEGHLTSTTLSLRPSWKEHEYIVVSLLPERPHYKVKPVSVYLQPTDDGWNVIGLRRRD